MKLIRRAGLGLVFCLILQTDSGYGAESKPVWQSEWEKTLAAAKQEGQVTVYIKAGYDGVLPAFQKKFPDIKVVSVAGEASDLTNRLIAERRAGKYIADVYSIGVRSVSQLYSARALDPIKPLLLLPEVVDESKWFEGHRYADPEKEHIFIYLSIAEQGVGYNTKVVNPKDFSSWWDFLQPKWKGKIVARDPRTPGPGNGTIMFFYNNPELGPEFVKKLFGEMDVTLVRDLRAGQDWLGSGKFPLGFFLLLDKAKEQGLPVDNFSVRWKEGAGIVSQSGNLVFLKNAPHPNAAKIFVNWLLSREGQTEIQKMIAKVQPAESRRIDITKDDVPIEVRRKDGVKYMDMDSRAEWRDMEPARKLISEVLPEGQKK